jgi:hypothetical protein
LEGHSGGIAMTQHTDKGTRGGGVVIWQVSDEQVRPGVNGALCKR